MKGPLCPATSGWSGAIRPVYTVRECTTVRGRVQNRTLLSRHQRLVRSYPTRLYREIMYNSLGKGLGLDPCVMPPVADPGLSDPP
jgi:hypothetical protein